MNDALLVAVANARQQLVHDHGRLFLSDALSPEKFVEKFATPAHVHDDVEALGVFEEVINMDYVGMVKLFHISDFDQKTFQFVFSHQTFLDHPHCPWNLRILINADPNISVVGICNLLSDSVEVFNVTFPWQVVSYI